MIGHGGAPTMRPWGIRDQLDGVHNLAALFADPKAFAKNLSDYEALLRKNEEAEKKARQAEAALKAAKALHDKREQAVAAGEVALKKGQDELAKERAKLVNDQATHARDVQAFNAAKAEHDRQDGILKDKAQDLAGREQSLHHEQRALEASKTKHATELKKLAEIRDSFIARMK